MYSNPIFGFVSIYIFMADVAADGCLFRTGIAKALYGVISLSNSLRTISSFSDGDLVIPSYFATKFFSAQKDRTESLWCVLTQPGNEIITLIRSKYREMVKNVGT